MTESNRFIADIEALRAIAVLGVIGTHLDGGLLLRNGGIDEIAWLLSLMKGGWVGVDFFFAISGFVIARSFMPQANPSAGFAAYKYVTWRFWLARLFRLAPSAWLWLLIVLGLCLAYNQSGVFGDIRTNLYWTISGVFNFSNILFAETFMRERQGVSFVYWSLSLEEQFYLLFPIIILLFRKYLACLLALVVLIQVQDSRGLYPMMFRTDAIALGVLLAMAQHRGWMIAPDNILPIWLHRALVVGLIGALFYFASFDQSELVYQVSILAWFSVAVVWLCSGTRNVLAKDGPLGRLLVWIGGRSYAMYLVHIPAMYFLRETAHRLGISLEDYAYWSVLLLLALVAVLSAVNYSWIELPLRSRGKSWVRRIGPPGQVND